MVVDPCARRQNVTSTTSTFNRFPAVSLPPVYNNYHTDSDDLSSNDSFELDQPYQFMAPSFNDITTPSFALPRVTKTHYTTVNDLCRIIQAAVDDCPPTGITVDRVFELVYYTQAVRMTAAIETDFVGFLSRHIRTGDIYASYQNGVINKFEGY